MMIRATSRTRKNHPIRIRIVCGKTDPANRIRPDSGCPLAVMAITGRIQNGSIMFTGVTFECSAAGESNMENRRILGRFYGLCWQNIVTTEQLYFGKLFLRKGLGDTAILTGMLLCFAIQRQRIKELRKKVPASIFPLLICTLFSVSLKTQFARWTQPECSNCVLSCCQRLPWTAFSFSFLVLYVHRNRKAY